MLEDALVLVSRFNSEQIRNLAFDEINIAALEGRVRPMEGTVDIHDWVEMEDGRLGKRRRRHHHCGKKGRVIGRKRNGSC